jgi:REP element-mobilizing transposase RayT
MRAPRRHRGAQRELDLRPRTRAGKVAKRPGRKPTGRRSDPRHRTRPEVSPRHPVHVVLRVTREVGNLRKLDAYRAIRGALGRCLARSDYRVVHVSIQSNHLHLLVEADDKDALARGMQGFAISAAKRLNRALRRRRGDVFAYRYHATPITSPTQARNAIAYILNNWRRHRNDVRAPWRIDPYSSAEQFAGWKTPHGYATRREPLPCVGATTWLLTDGWSRAGPIRTDEVPGPDPLPGPPARCDE